MTVTEILIRVILGLVALNIGVQWFFLKKLWSHEQRISLIEGKIIQHLGNPDELLEQEKSIKKAILEQKEGAEK